MILVGFIEGPGGGKLREAIRDAVAEHFGEFAFQAPVQVGILSGGA